MKKTILLAILALSATALRGQELPLAADGTIPFWLTNGPFETRTIGFGDLSADGAIDEAAAQPRLGDRTINASSPQGETPWRGLSAGPEGYTDLLAFYGWQTLATTEKIWYARIIYAYAEIRSPQEQQATLHFGGNTITGITLNGAPLYESLHEVNSVRDNFSRPVLLRQGVNRLLLRIATTHRSHATAFWDPLRFEWGFYCRLTSPANQPPAGLSLHLARQPLKADFVLTSTFFYREREGRMRQKYLLEITAPLPGLPEARFALPGLGEELALGSIAAGTTMHELWLPEPARPQQTRAVLAWQGRRLEKRVELRALPKYELYFMPLTHMDIGYTNPQPVVIERQLQTLDQVMEKCRADSAFRWTIETMWLLENYRQSRRAAAFDELLGLIKAGRIAVSPLSTNPYTGWVSEAEMAAAFRLAREYRQRYGLTFHTAVYNDVPGQSWALPQYLRQAGVQVLVDGINELFADYKFQKSLPKAFYWAGASPDTVLLYLTEAYVEGARYGLERDTTAISRRIWHRLNNLQRRGYPWTKILISGAFSDNSGIALNQYDNARRWNEHYAWPRFVIATLDDFGRALTAEIAATPAAGRAALPVIRGDWTSDWDILYQGETKRMIRYREVQNLLPGTEILTAIAAALQPLATTGAVEIDAIYASLLNFSGHGSGLEYGLGSREENLYTDAVREEYVDEAALRRRALAERALYRIAAPKESFDSQGVLVFNTLAWDRDLVVEIDFPVTDQTAYEVMDLAAGRKIPAHRQGERLTFIAAGVPGIGSKQFELVTPAAAPAGMDVQAGAASPAPAGTARLAPAKEPGDSATIENRFYQVRISGGELQILDRRSGLPLLDPEAALPSFTPLRKRFQLGEDFLPVARPAAPPQVAVNPVWQEMSIRYDHPLFRTIRFRLWHEIDRIDIALEADLGGLDKTAHTEEYGLPFAFNPRGGEIRPETLGGLTGLADRFPGVGHNYFAIRRAIAVTAGPRTLLLASPDCRIFALDTLKGATTVIANLVNNFPDAWNRNEDTSGQVTFRFFLAVDGTTAADAAAFGWEAATAPLLRKSWFTRAEPLRRYLTNSNPRIKVLSLRPSAEESGRWELLLQNSEPASRQEVTLTSALFFSAARVQRLNLLGQPASWPTEQPGRGLAGTSNGSGESAIPVRDATIFLSLAPNEIVRLEVVRQ